MTAPLTFKKAERTSVKLKIGIQGPAGSGKTLGALALAHSLAGNGRIAVIDSENESASFYADKFAFETLSLEPPYTSKRYIEAIQAAVAAGFDVLVIDSISHQWAGTGGILERKDEVDQRGGNSFTNWGPFTKEHELFKARILEAPIHIISTLRTKQEYSLDKDDRGKATPKKMGMAPIQREAFEYEFGVVFELQMDHRAKISKDRTELFDDTKLYNLVGDGIGKILLSWLASAKPAPEKPPPAVAAPADVTEASLTVEAANALPLPGREGSWSGKAGEPLGSFSSGHLKTIRDWLVTKLADHDNDQFATAVAAIRMILADRDKDQTTLQLDSAPAELSDAPDPATATAGDVADKVEQRETVGAAVGDLQDNDLPF